MILDESNTMPVALPTNPFAPASPILKWVGGKSRLVPEILTRLPARCAVYREPFVGSGAVFFAYERMADNCIIGDANGALMDTYLAISMYPTEIHAHLRQLASDWSDGEVAGRKALYYELRDEFNATYRCEDGRMALAAGLKAPLVRNAVLFCFLNRACFNGLWRVHQTLGTFNVPWGQYKSLPFPPAAAFEAASVPLSEAHLQACDFAPAIEAAERGDVVYVDSPYPSVFAGYAKSGEGGFDARHPELAEACFAAAARGAHVLVSISDVPLSRQLYGKRGATLDVVTVQHAVGATAERRRAVKELLVTIPSASAKKKKR